MRSEVVKVMRTSETTCGCDFGMGRHLSNLLPELKLHQEKSVRISVEIVDEKGEEKVGSKAKWFIRKKQGESCDLVSLQCRGETWSDDWAYASLKEMCKDLPYGNHHVESIDFINGKIKFIETPRERLKRAVNESFRGPEDIAIVDLRAAVLTYLDAATEEAEKKGGG